MEISNISFMNLLDLEEIKNVLLTDFDDFWSYTILEKELENENSKYIVFRNEQHKIIGFAGIWICLDEADITNIVVNKNFRKQGIGTILLENLIVLAKGLKLNKLNLEVNENNIPAIKLYENLGFEKVGLRKKYYNNTDNAILMTKHIAE